MGDIYHYEPSPDRMRAALRFVVQEQEQAVVYSPLEESLDWIGSPSHIAWSPDGSALAVGYASDAAGAFRLSVYDAATGTAQVVLDSSHPDIPALDRSSNWVFAAKPAWSPAGDKLAIAVLYDSASGMAGFAAAMNADGSGLALLPQAPGAFPADRLAYSADGRYLVEIPWPGQSNPALFDALTLRPVRQFHAPLALAWAPEGHTLALLDADGLLLLDDPANVDAPGLRVTGRGCNSVVWK